MFLASNSQQYDRLGTEGVGQRLASEATVLRRSVVENSAHSPPEAPRSAQTSMFAGSAVQCLDGSSGSAQLPHPV